MTIRLRSSSSFKPYLCIISFVGRPFHSSCRFLGQFKAIQGYWMACEPACSADSHILDWEPCDTLGRQKELIISEARWEEVTKGIIAQKSRHLSVISHSNIGNHGPLTCRTGGGTDPNFSKCFRAACRIFISQYERSACANKPAVIPMVVGNDAAQTPCRARS